MSTNLGPADIYSQRDDDNIDEDDDEEGENSGNHSGAGGNTAAGRWTDEEHTRFLQALVLYGKNWNKVHRHVGSRTSAQTRSHA